MKAHHLIFTFVVFALSCELVTSRDAAPGHMNAKTPENSVKRPG